MKMFTPLEGGTPLSLSRANSAISVSSNQTVAYRNISMYDDFYITDLVNFVWRWIILLPMLNFIPNSILSP